MPVIALPEYRPDVAVVNSGFTDVLVNMFPSISSYIPVKQFIPLTQSFPEKIIAAYSIMFGNKIKIVAGSERKLYFYDDTSKKWMDISRTGSEYSAVNWSFALFGKLLIAANINDVPQAIDITTTGTRFKDLGGNPPKAGIVKVWGDIVCLMQ